MHTQNRGSPTTTTVVKSKRKYKDVFLKVDLDLHFNTYATEESRIAVRSKDIIDSRVVIYLDDRYDCVPFSVDGPLQNFTAKVNLVGVLKKSHRHRVKVNAIPIDTRICIQTYRKIPNENDDFCFVDNGFCTFLLSAGESGQAEDDTAAPYYLSPPPQSQVTLKREADLVLKTVHEDNVKGRIILKAAHARMGLFSPNKNINSYSKVAEDASANGKGKALPMAFYSSPRVIYNVKESQVGFERAMEPYFKQYQAESQLFSPSIVGTDKIKCPFCPSEDTFADDRNEFSPLAAYMFYPKPSVSLEYWVNALNIAADRMGSTVQQLDTFYDGDVFQNTQEKANFAVKLSCQYAQLFDYVSDTSVDSRTGKKSNIEMFGDALQTLCGDCEDLALAVYAMADNLTYHVDLPGLNEYISRFGTKDGWSTLQYVRWFLRCYVPVLTIDGVSSAHVNKKTVIDGGKEQKEGEVKIDGAHAANVFFPMDYFSQALSRWEPNQVIVKELEKQLSYRINELQHITGKSIMQRADFVRFLSTLPVLMGEGTGLLNPQPKTDSHFDLNREMNSSELFRKKMKRELTFPVENNPFYKAVLFGTSTLFMQRLALKSGTFRFTYIDAHPQMDDFTRYPGGGTLSTGILFSDLINRRADVAAIPYGLAIKNGPNESAKVRFKDSQGETVSVPAEFTDEQMEYIKLSAVVRVPPLAITMSEETTKKAEYKNSNRGKPRMIVQMEDKLRTMLTGRGIAKQEGGGGGGAAVSLLIRRYYVKEESLTDRFFNEMIALVSYLLRKDAPLTDVKFTYECHSDCFGIWRVSFYFSSN